MNQLMLAFYSNFSSKMYYLLSFVSMANFFPDIELYLMPAIFLRARKNMDVRWQTYDMNFFFFW